MRDMCEWRKYASLILFSVPRKMEEVCAAEGVVVIDDVTNASPVSTKRLSILRSDRKASNLTLVRGRDSRQIVRRR